MQDVPNDKGANLFMTLKPVPWTQSTEDVLLHYLIDRNDNYKLHHFNTLAAGYGPVAFLALQTVQEVKATYSSQMIADYLVVTSTLMELAIEQAMTTLDDTIYIWAGLPERMVVHSFPLGPLREELGILKEDIEQYMKDTENG